MFSTLESTWDRSARRGWTTLASLTIQVFGLSLLFVVSLFWIERPPKVRWLEITAPAAFTPAAPTEPARGHHSNSTANTPAREQITAPPSIPSHVSINEDQGPVPSAPDLPDTGIGADRGPGNDVAHSIGNGFPVAIPARPPAAKPLLVSHWAEGNLLYRVQPIYPPIARQARVQGTVELRAVISKSGTIENLVVDGGHPMLSKAAVEAVRQWRYRPYLLNNEPIEVETEITVNFLLSGG